MLLQRADSEKHIGRCDSFKENIVAMMVFVCLCTEPSPASGKLYVYDEFRVFELLIRFLLS